MSTRSPTNCPVNTHWRPYVTDCGYCSTNYTVIAKVDTFAADLEKISSLAGVRLKKDVHSNQNFALSGKVAGRHQTSAELAHTYFTGLPRMYREQLYEAYKIDFDMFGYDPDIYLNL